MSKDKLTDYDATASNNTDVGGISVAEGMLPSGVNNAIREQMSHLKDFASGTTGIDVLSLADDDASHAIKLQAPSAVTADTTFTLPDGDGASGQTMITDGAGTLAWAAPYGNRNLIINGAMQVAQRGTSVTELGATDGYFTLDRFKVAFGAASAGRFTMSQSTVTDLAGFSNALKLDCTTIDTSIAAGELFVLQHVLEGFNLQRLKASSTSTQAFTLSFYAKSNASRAIATEFEFTNGTNRQISKLHTIGTSWARYTMTVPAASSTQIDDDNSAELTMSFWLHAGNTYTSGTINDDALAPTTSANRAPGIGSLFASTDNTLEITGVQLEVGSGPATPFEHPRSYGDELIRCQRYFEGGTRANSSHTGNAGAIWTQKNDSSSRSFPQMNAEYKVFKRATPTVTIESGQDGTANSISGYSSGTNYTVTSIQSPSPSYVCSYFQTTGGLPDQITVGYYTADAEL